MTIYVINRNIHKTKRNQIHFRHWIVLTIIQAQLLIAQFSILNINPQVQDVAVEVKYVLSLF